MIRLKTLLILALLPIGLAFAGGPSVSLDMKMEVNGQAVSIPKAVVELGKKSIFHERLKNQKISYSIEVIATTAQAGEILLDFKITEIKGGVRQLLSSPKIVTLNGQQASIEQSSKDPGDKPRIKLTVTPLLND